MALVKCTPMTWKFHCRDLTNRVSAVRPAASVSPYLAKSDRKRAVPPRLAWALGDGAGRRWRSRAGRQIVRARCGDRGGFGSSCGSHLTRSVRCQHAWLKLPIPPFPMGTDLWRGARKHLQVTLCPMSTIAIMRQQSCSPIPPLRHIIYLCYYRVNYYS
jgi:hypothetical protein